MKLVVAERESSALSDELARWPRRASSVLARIEVERAARRLRKERRATSVISGLTMLAIDDGVVELAVESTPPVLRALDAIHLASALALGDDLGSFIVYDRRLADAARQLGLPVVSPS